jgi:hypothetical protein
VIKYETKKIIDFLDELGLFIEENSILRKKKSVALPFAVWRDFKAVHEFCPPVL